MEFSRIAFICCLHGYSSLTALFLAVLQPLADYYEGPLGLPAEKTATTSSHHSLAMSDGGPKSSIIHTEFLKPLFMNTSRRTQREFRKIKVYEEPLNDLGSAFTAKRVNLHRESLLAHT